MLHALLLANGARAGLPDGAPVLRRGLAALAGVAGTPIADAPRKVLVEDVQRIAAAREGRHM